VAIPHCTLQGGMLLSCEYISSPGTPLRFGNDSTSFCTAVVRPSCLSVHSPWTIVACAIRDWVVTCGLRGESRTRSYLRCSMATYLPTLNLSMVGCRARSTHTITKDESLGMLIDVPRCEHPLYISRAEVRWSDGQEFGTEFIHIELEDRQRLAEIIRMIEAGSKPGTVGGEADTLSS